ncbi:MAG: DUF378 domain-containing protein [Gammaproteobacteria bacterium]
MKLGLFSRVIVFSSILAAFNYGLIGIFHVNLVGYMFQAVPMVEKVVYIALGYQTLTLALNNTSNAGRLIV